MGEIFLIRHGQASFGEPEYDRLSETGITQSRVLGEWLRAQGLRFDAVYAGERLRQQDTARLALEALPGGAPALAVEPAFNELDADRLMQHAVPRLVLQDPAVAELLVDLRAHRDRFRRLFERVVDEWVEGGWQAAGIGTWPSFSDRVTQGVSTLARRHGPGRRIAVFTSGGPITAMLQALGARQTGGLDWDIANTSITRVAFDADGGLRLVAAREVPHLSARRELLTHL